MTLASYERRLLHFVYHLERLGSPLGQYETGELICCATAVKAMREQGFLTPEQQKQYLTNEYVKAY